MSQKSSHLQLSLTLSNLNRFSKFLHRCKAHEIGCKTCMTLPPHLKVRCNTTSGNSKFKSSADVKENASKLHFNLLLNSESFPILIANKIFHVSVLLLVYFCDQFVAPKPRHSRRHCSVCRQSTWYSAMRTRF